MERLSRIVARIGNRENALFAVFNLLLLWDYHCVEALSRWKRESGRRLGTWLETLAVVEALGSLANLRFEHPEWVFPEIVRDEEAAARLWARRLGHPLIGEERVCNDFALTPVAPVAPITGSIMAGKTTFLRTVGINLVLAYAGAPVCAASLRCSRLAVWTSIRNMDNLARGNLLLLCRGPPYQASRGGGRTGAAPSVPARRGV